QGAEAEAVTASWAKRDARSKPPWMRSRSNRAMRRGIEIDNVLGLAEAGKRLDREDALALIGCEAGGRLSAAAESLCIAGHGRNVSFSKKVFIPLTQLCADVCHYCTFAHAPR